MKQPKHRVSFTGGPQDGRQDRYPSPLPDRIVFQRCASGRWITDEYQREGASDIYRFIQGS